MTFKPSVWFPIAVVLSLINVGAAGFAANEPVHAGTHAMLAVAFGLWAQALRQRQRRDEFEGGQIDEERFEALETELGRVRQELGETQERLDFVERMLAQPPEARRVGPDH